MVDNIHAAALQVVDAIRNEGSHPNFHRTVIAKHRREWPTLWCQLDRLIEQVENGKW